MINFIKIAKELYAQVNISNRDIFYSEYKLRLKDNPEDLSIALIQHNLDMNLPFLKEEEMFYLSAIANKFTVNDIKDEIEEHNRQYGTNFSLKDFKEIYSKNHNLLMNYIDSLKQKDGAIIRMYPEIFTVYYLLNSSLTKILAFQGKEISKKTKENLPEKYKQKINIISAINLVNKFVTEFIKYNVSNFDNNIKIINEININIFPKIVDLKSKIKIIANSIPYNNIIEEISLDIYNLKSSIENLNPYTILEYGYITNILEKYINFNKSGNEELDNLLEILKSVCMEIKKFLINFNTCYSPSMLPYIFTVTRGFPIDVIFDTSIKNEIEKVFEQSKNKFLLSDVDNYSNIIKQYIIDDIGKIYGIK